MPFKMSKINSGKSLQRTYANVVG